MATYFFTGGVNANWGTAGNWSLTSGGPGDGAVPTSTDTARFDSNSPACTVNVSANCQVLDCRGGTGDYANTLTMNNPISTFGNITLSPSMTIAGTSVFVPSASGTWTSNAIVVTGGITLATGVSSLTITLADDWTIQRNVTGSNNPVIFTFNGNKLNIGGTFTMTSNANQSFTGTTELVFNGTGNIITNSLGGIGNSITFDTTGTITLLGTIVFGGAGRTMKRIKGEIITKGSTIQCTTNNTFDCPGMVFDTIQTLNSSSPITLSSDLYVTTLTAGGATNATPFNGNTIYINILIPGTAGMSGTSAVVLANVGYSNGIGAWSGGPVANNVTINTTGVLNITNARPTGNFTYVSGVVNHLSGGTLFLTVTGKTLTNCHKIRWRSIIITGGITVSMNHFFSSVSQIITSIDSSNSTNYTINITGTGAPNVSQSFFTKISMCTLTKPGSVNMDYIFANQGNNVGVTWINQSLNSFPLNELEFPPELMYGFGSDGLRGWITGS